MKVVFPFHVAESEIQKIVSRIHTKWILLYRHEITMFMIVRMRPLTKELLILIDVTSHANSMTD